ncbi:MAG TPA: formate dehydrogenase accessory protein FdhE [Candidatus Methylomirabilis sp.]|nr:formate dehydrogenase accessory protein FdhE [Candidatus Methylomirabilis sp.]
MVPGDPHDVRTQDLKAILGRLEALLDRPDLSAPYVRFRIDLLKAQWAVRESLATTNAPAACMTPTGNTLRNHPALDLDALPFDPGLLQSAFATLCDGAARHGHQTEDIRLLREAVQTDPSLLPRLVRKSASEPDQEYLESLARQLRVLPDVLLFIGRALAAPVVAEAVRRFGPHPQVRCVATETPGRCRMCGSPPTMATLRREDGRRILTCGLCGTGWEFPRLACPWCGTRDREALSILRLSPEDPRWIEACESCRGYIKTVDERRLPVGEPVLPVVEEAATLHLDLLAEREGYLCRLPYVLSG